MMIDNLDFLDEWDIDVDNEDFTIWTTAQGEDIHIENMADNHIQNCINLLKRYGDKIKSNEKIFEDKPEVYDILKWYQLWINAFKEEQNRRIEEKTVQERLKNNRCVYRTLEDKVDYEDFTGHREYKISLKKALLLARIAFYEWCGSDDYVSKDTAEDLFYLSLIQFEFGDVCTITPSKLQWETYINS